jgi:ketosteroid isomerase-like protein
MRNRGELEPMLDMYAEDAVFDVSAVFTDVAPMRGHQNMLRYWNELRETWKGPDGPTRDVRSRRRALRARSAPVGKGRRSGAEVDQRFAFLYTIRLKTGR